MTVHVIGAGMAGLAAAVRLAQRKVPVVLWEAGPEAGGRVRSLACPVLGRTIDNGTHLVLSGNTSVADYLKTIGAAKRMETGEAAFPFVELNAVGGADLCWSVRPGKLPLPLWVLSASRRVPGAGLREYMRVRHLASARVDQTVADCVGTTGALFRRFWVPLTLAVMNAEPEDAAALPFARALGETMLRGGASCRPMMAKKSLHHALVEPALTYLEKRNATVRLGARLTRLAVLEDKVHSLAFADEVVEVEKDDAVVLALPPWALAKVWPGAKVPVEARGILNMHYRVGGMPAGIPSLTGVVGGRIHWVAVRGDVVSVTVSAADSLMEKPGESLARQLWQEVARVIGVGADHPVPPFRVIKERRGTPVQTPAVQALRANPRTGLRNVTLAGDWTATGLPATIEGAVRSGFTAADVVGNLDF